MSINAFDAIAAAYDAWYDTPKGRPILHAEISCLRLLWAQCKSRWLEVGVGTGRFAQMLGIGEGIDSSLPMLDVAVRRGIKVCQGAAEALPFPEDSFDGVLLACTLCFADDPLETLRECRRTLRQKGTLLLGIIPADSPLGAEYAQKKASGHSVYTHARFHTVAEIRMMLLDTGFEFLKASSTLLGSIETPSQDAYCVKPGVVSHAGFVGLLARKPITRTHGKSSRTLSCEHQMHRGTL